MNTVVVPATPPKAEVKPPKPMWKRFLTMDNRYLPPILITCILLSGQFTFGMLESWTRTAAAIAAAIAAELILSRWITSKWPHLASAYITGISVGILIRSPFYWPYIFCAVISIMSKYVLRWRGKHLWNPSNFGVSATLFLYPEAAASLSIQWGNNLAPMAVVWCLGLIIVTRIKRLHITLTYPDFLGFLRNSRVFNEKASKCSK